MQRNVGRADISIWVGLTKPVADMMGERPHDQALPNTGLSVAPALLMAWMPPPLTASQCANVIW